MFGPERNGNNNHNFDFNFPLDGTVSSSNVSVINPLCMVALTQGMESARRLTAQTLEINQSWGILRGVAVEKMDERLAGEGEEQAKTRDLVPLTTDRLTLFPTGSSHICHQQAGQRK